MLYILWSVHIIFACGFYNLYLCTIQHSLNDNLSENKVGKCSCHSNFSINPWRQIPSTKTGDYPPNPVGWVPKCGDFGNLTQPFGVVTCPRGAGCGKETGKTLNGEKWSFHNCSLNMESHHGRDGCWKVFNSEIGKGKKKQCRWSTDL